MRKYGFVSEIPVNASHEVIVGEMLLEAATRLGMTMVPVVRKDGLSDSEERALRLTLKKLPT